MAWKHKVFIEIIELRWISNTSIHMMKHWSLKY